MLEKSLRLSNSRKQEARFQMVGCQLFLPPR